MEPVRLMWASGRRWGIRWRNSLVCWMKGTTWGRPNMTMASTRYIKSKLTRHSNSR